MGERRGGGVLGVDEEGTGLDGLVLLSVVDGLAVAVVVTVVAVDEGCAIGLSTTN